MLGAFPVAMLRAMPNGRTNGLTLEALPLAMEMTHSVTRATNRINEGESK